MPKATKRRKRSSRQEAGSREADADPIRQPGASENATKVSWMAWVSVILCLLVSIVALWLDGTSRVEMVEKISRVSFSEAAPQSLPISPGAKEEWLVLPYYAMDARWWVLHTERMLREGDWRIRHTELDNAPAGREVHWSSLLMWILAGLAMLQSKWTGLPAEGLVAESAMIAGPVMIVLFLASLTALVVVRFRLFAACFFALVLLTSYPFIRTFLTGEADHHGIVVVFALAGIVCLLAAELRPMTKADGRRWFMAGGILGAASLWISAATAIPILVGIALGGFLANVATTSRGGEESLSRAELWMIWGLAGGIASLGFYLLEYFPGQMGWRLEVNHPIYAAAWIGGAFLLSRTMAWRATGQMPLRNRRDVALALAALAALLAPAVLIITMPDKVFWVSDKFLLKLHKEYILEFQSLFTANRVSGDGYSWLTQYTWPIAVLVCAGVLGFTGKLGSLGRRGLLIIAPVVVVTQLMTVSQVRWASAAFGAWSLAVLILAADLILTPSEDVIRRWTFRGLVAWAWVAIFLTLLPQVAHRAEEERTCLQAPIPRDIAGNLLLRDVAHRLIQSSLDRIPVVLTGPNASTEMTYHAGLRTLGTLYWENMPGLKRAARIFSVQDEASALKEITDAGVTHIVVPSWDNFAEAYARLLAQAEGRETTKAPFFKAIVEGEECPDWLRPFAYPIPTDSGLDANSVKIFAVLPGQSRFESLYYRGVYFFEIGQPEKARALFNEAAALRPADERPKQYLREIEAAGKPAQN